MRTTVAVVDAEANANGHAEVCEYDDLNKNILKKITVKQTYSHSRKKRKTSHSYSRRHLFFCKSFCIYFLVTHATHLKISPAVVGSSQAKALEKKSIRRGTFYDVSDCVQWIAGVYTGNEGHLMSSSRHLTKWDCIAWMTATRSMANQPHTHATRVLYTTHDAWKYMSGLLQSNFTANLKSSVKEERRSGTFSLTTLTTKQIHYHSKVYRGRNQLYKKYV